MSRLTRTQLQLHQCCQLFHGQRVLAQGWLQKTHFQHLKDTCSHLQPHSSCCCPSIPPWHPPVALLGASDSCRDGFDQIQQLPSSDLSCRQVVSSCKSSSIILSYPKIWQMRMLHPALKPEHQFRISAPVRGGIFPLRPRSPDLFSSRPNS